MKPLRRGLGRLVLACPVGLLVVAFCWPVF